MLSEFYNNSVNLLFYVINHILETISHTENYYITQNTRAEPLIIKYSFKKGFKSYKIFFERSGRTNIIL